MAPKTKIFSEVLIWKGISISTNEDNFLVAMKTAYLLFLLIGSSSAFTGPLLATRAIATKKVRPPVLRRWCVCGLNCLLQKSVYTRLD